VTSDNTTQQVGLIYARLSKDKKGGGIGTERQVGDCRDLSARLNIPVEAVFKDNDLTAVKGTKRSKPRPGYDSLIQRLKNGPGPGRAYVVLAWHTDRLHRDVLELEDYIRVCGEGSDGIPTYTVRGGDLDLSTANGRMVARLLGVVARQEVEHMVERQLDNKRAVREAGGRVGGSRPFGYNLDTPTRDNPAGKGLKPNPVEAPLLAEAYAAVLADPRHRVLPIARQWNAAGIFTPRKTKDPAKTGKGCGGVPWTAGTVKQVLLRAANAGLIEHQGHIIGPAVWQPIVSPDDWRAVRTHLSSAQRRTSPGPEPKYLLTGVLICGVCGSMRFGVVKGSREEGRRYYACRSYMNRDGVPTKVAGHPQRRMDLLDSYVEEIIIERLSRPDVVRAFNAPAVDMPTLEGRRDALRAQLDELAGLFSEGVLDGSQLAAGSRALRPKLAHVEAEIAEALREAALAEFAGVSDPAQVWDSLPIGRQRAIAQMMLRVRLRPAGNTRPAGWKVGDRIPFDGESVEILPPDAAPAPAEDAVAEFNAARKARQARDATLTAIIVANPAISDCAAAKQAGPGVDHSHAGTARRRLEAAGQIPVMFRRGHRNAARRGQLADVLRANPEISDGAAGRQVGADVSLVGRVRRELEEQGHIPVLRRVGRGKPVNHGQQQAG
jgi:DNA invertase Pin-like site-specific DNA recombinase